MGRVTMGLLRTCCVLSKRRFRKKRLPATKFLRLWKAREYRSGLSESVTGSRSSSTSASTGEP